MADNDIGLGVELELGDPDDFLKIKETLTRIGVSSNKTKTIYQSCHILHKRGKYYLMHFKEMFKLDGKPSDISEEDVQRRDVIAILIRDWGLAKLKDSIIEPPKSIMKHIKVLPYSEKGNWQLVAKYTVGTKGHKYE